MAPGGQVGSVWGHTATVGQAVGVWIHGDLLQNRYTTLNNEVSSGAQGNQDGFPRAYDMTYGTNVTNEHNLNTHNHAILISAPKCFKNELIMFMSTTRLMIV